MFPSIQRPLPRWARLLVALTLFGNVLAWLTIATLPDEAYYWIWSQRLELGYYDHPPLIAWLIRPFSELFGNSHWSIRLPSVIAWSIGAYCAWLIAGQLYKSRTAAMAALLIWCTLPIMQVGFHIVTPDSALVLLTWISFYFALRALQEGHLIYWIATGAALGLTVAAKYPGGIVALALLAGLLLSPQGRQQLLTRNPWLGIASALLCFSPVLLWNYQHDWISFTFQLHHGIKDLTGENDGGLLPFLVGQSAAVMPWTLAAMVFASLRSGHYLRDVPQSYRPLLQAGFWLPLLIFGLAAITAKSHPNWPVSAYIPGTIILAGLVDQLLFSSAKRPLVKITVVALIIAPLLLVNLLRFPHWMAWTPSPDKSPRTQLSQSYGWDKVGPELRKMVDEIEQQKGLKGRCVVIGDRLQSASMAGLLLQQPLRVTTADTTRTNQFHLWRKEEPIDTEQLCLYLEQFETEAAIRHTIRLGGWGTWYLAKSLHHQNPDQSERYTALYTRTRQDH